MKGQMFVKFFLFMGCFCVLRLLAAQSTELVFSIENGFIFTQIEINRQPMKVMIDWGDAQALRLSASWARQQNIALNPTGTKVYWVDGRGFEEYEGSIEHLKIGDWERKDVAFAAADEETEIAARETGVAFDGAIGFGAFYGLYVHIDYPNRRIRMSKTAFEELKTEHYFRLSGKKATVYVPIKVGKKKHRFVLDTGCAVSVLDEKTFSEIAPDAAFELEVSGKRLQLDKTERMDLSIMRKERAVGILGGDFLLRNALYLDPLEKRAYICR